ncbi:MAG: PQQ-binding-like beta-propeller repeat protein [Planctomycetales bacterium]|nr:PQQ-binding-like beta-propeller repeat protein [Planctomycetales bacterium]
MAYVWRRRLTRFSLVLLCYLQLPHSRAEDWPGWRGPRGDGSSVEQQLPITWDGATGQNIVWRTALPGEGHSSPIVVGERVFVTACLPAMKSRVLMCLSAENGHVQWQRDVITSELESIHTLNSRASGTPACDGKAVYLAFMKTDGHLVTAPNVGAERDITAGEMVAAAYDIDGNLLWNVVLGPFVSAHGFCTSPVLYRNLVIFNGDHDGDSYLVALEKSTGRERWRIKRDHGIRSYVTPLIREINGRAQMVLSGSKHILSLDPATGATHWRIDGPTEQFVASMVYDGKYFYMNCGYPDYFVFAIRPDGQSDAVAWESTQARSYVPSPVVLDDYLIVADDRGTVNCFATSDGERLWQARIGSGFNSSPVHAGGLVYLTDNDGKTSVLKPGPEPDVVATSQLGEPVSASAAISDGAIFLRTDAALYCIRKQEK